MGSKQPLKFPLHIPNSCNVIIGTGKKTISWITPLNWWNKVTIICPIRELRLILHTNMTQLHPRARWGVQSYHSLWINGIIIPDIDIKISSSSSGEYFLSRIPFWVHNLTLMLINDPYTWAIWFKWDSIRSWGVTITLDFTL